jgi:hypothetical protein
MSVRTNPQRGARVRCRWNSTFGKLKLNAGSTLVMSPEPLNADLNGRTLNHRPDGQSLSISPPGMSASVFQWIIGNSLS